jgi:hypothetical protein
MIFDGDLHEGLPIGNYISQYFANIYLNELDWFVMRTLGCKRYVRYMDDFMIFAADKRDARAVFCEVRRFLCDELGLPLNANSRYYPLKMGVDFCGFRIFADYRLLRRRSKHKIRDIIHNYEDGGDTYDKFCERYTAWLGHAMHGDARRFTESVLGKYTLNGKPVENSAKSLLTKS